MKVYLDTGVFVDYLTYHGFLGSFLRKKGRRNRTVQQLHQDVSDCLDKISKCPDGFTSCLAMYEAEEALFARLMKASRGLSHGKKFAITSSRTLNLQILTIKQVFKLRILDLTEKTFEEEQKQISLQIKGIRAGDSLHMTTAILNDADMIITTDKNLLALDKIFQNAKGTQMQCLDTNIAKRIL